MTISSRRAGIAIALFVLTVGLGCTEEKGKALQVAAESFSAQATTAINAVRQLANGELNFGLEGQPDALKRMTGDLKGLKPEQVNAAILNEALQPDPAASSNPLNAELDKLDVLYAQFASMYKSLPAGSFFSGDAVKRSEALSVKLTVQMINVATGIQKNPYKNFGRRVLLIEKINAAKANSDAKVQDTLLEAAAQDVLQLRTDETNANNDAIRQCLMAAEAGRAVTTLIQDYSKMSLGDMLTLASNSLASIGLIANNPDVTGLVKKFNSIAGEIQKDPSLSPLLSQTIN